MSIASDLQALKKTEPKILTLDIETGPNVASIWRLFDENIGISQIHEVGQMISVAAKWEDAEKIYFWSVYHDGEEAMVHAIHILLTQADVVQHWNGKRFDVPWLNYMFLKYGLTPPRPFKEFDLMTAVKGRFRFASYKLDFVSQELGVGRKVEHEGYGLWHKCLFGTPEEKAAAWKLMRIYNMGDVSITENVKHRLIGWLHNYPALGTVNSDSALTCFVCQSTDLRADGTYTGGALIYPQYQCNICGTWMKGMTSIGRATNTKGIK